MVKSWSWPSEGWEEYQRRPHVVNTRRYIYLYRDIYKEIEIYIRIYIYGKMKEQGINSHINVHLRKILTQTIRL